MGNGRYKNGAFDLVAIANYVMPAADAAAWERCFGKVSEILYNASEGQMRFGNVFACDDSIGLESADAILYSAGDPSYSSGAFGHPGSAIHLMPYVQRQVLSLLHEFGHSAFNLGDEYSAAYIYDEIDRTNPAPDRHTIPIVNSGRPANQLTNLHASVFLTFGAQIERRQIVADTATSITVVSDFPDLATNATSDWAVTQAPAECSAVADSNYCIMEKSRGAAGTFDAAGNWQPVAHPVTEFCSASNHDPDHDTAQHASHAKSCWETIVDNPAFASLTVPNPASGVAPAGFTAPNWIMLDKQPRFVLVLDRSGSMAAGHKMADTQFGAIYWLQFCALGTDLLSIVWYDHQIDRILDLVQVDSLPSLTNPISAIKALTPRGTTNIRDALYEALDQIQSRPTRAAVQATLLLTDGMHNTPYGSHASEVLPSFKDGGARIYTLGVGSSLEVDMTVLDELAAETGGTSHAVGDNHPGDIEAAMVEINAEVRGGIITTNPLLFSDAKPSGLDKLLVEAKGKQRPPLGRILEALHVHSAQDLLGTVAKGGVGAVAIPVEVEAAMQRVSFTLVFPESQRLLLYLVDPHGTPVDMNSAPVQLVQSSAPHEFAIIKNPMPGRWLIVAVRVSSGPGFTARVVAGGENKQLRVWGGAQPANAARAPIRLWAKAQHRELLSGLTVTAEVTAPDGTRRKIRLSDDEVDDFRSGEYEGYYKARQLGRHHGVITIRNTGRAMAARPIQRLLDSDKNTLPARADAPAFVRRIPFYFDSGQRPEPRDVEQKKGLTHKYESIRPRKTKLISAENR